MRKLFVFLILNFFWSMVLCQTEGVTEQESAGAFRALQQEKAAKAARAVGRISEEQAEAQRARPLPLTPAEKAKKAAEDAQKAKPLPATPTEMLEKVKTDKEKSKEVIKQAEKQVDVIKAAKKAYDAAKKTGNEASIKKAQEDLKKANQDLYSLEAKSVGRQAFDPNEGGPIDRAMNKAGLWLSNKFPNLSAKLTLMSIKTNVAGNNFGPLRRFDERCADFSQNVADTFSLNRTFKVSNKELNAAFSSKKGDFDSAFNFKISQKLKEKSVQDDITKRLEQAKKKLKEGETLDENKIIKEVEGALRTSLYKESEEAYKKNLRTQLINEKIDKDRDTQLAQIVSDRDVNEVLKMPETQKKLREILTEKVNAKMQEKAIQDNIEKLIRQATKKLKKGQTVDKKKIEDKVRADIEKILKKDLENEFKKTIKSSLVSPVINAKIEKKMGKGFARKAKKLQKKYGETSQAEALEYKQSLEATAKRAGWTDEAIKKALEDPKSEEFKKLMVYHKIREDIIEDAKKTFKEKAWAWLNDMHDGRDFCASKKGWALVGVGTLAMVLTAVIGNLVTAKIKAEASNSSDWDMITKGQTDEGEELKLDTGESVTKEEYKSFGLTTEVMKYYATIDESFKQALKTIDYYSKNFNVVQKVSYEQDSVTAGLSVLFNYTGAGDIASGLVPVVVKAYPTHILGQFLSQSELLKGITNQDGIELVGALLRNAPEVIFFLRVIALINTANTKFTDVNKRLKFLNEEVRLLHIRLTRTVDYVSTTNLNVFEPNEKEWETIYMKTPGQCFKNAPQVIRDYVAEINVDYASVQGGESKISLEEYLINQFEVFDKLRKFKFEGDIDFSVPTEKFSDVQVEDYLFALFIRVLDEVSRLESLFIVRTDPVKIIDDKGVSQTIVWKSLFESIISKKLKEFKLVQNKFIDASMEYAGDPKSVKIEKAYKVAEENLNKAISALEEATLEFRKKIIFYPFERTLGYESERILDVIKRECKRAYQNAQNKNSFAGIFTKVYGLFSKNFPVSEKDLLKYAQNSEPIKSPVKVIGAGVEK